jgi:deferrochelatase/peroxidase EfeB
MMAAAALDLSDIQRPIAYGYNFHRSRHFILTVADSAGAKQFLRGLCERITTATLTQADIDQLQKDGRCAINVGFTYAGLAALRLDGRYLRVLQEKAPPFVEGAFVRAAARLADTGPSAVSRWEDRFKPAATHVLLSLHGDTETALNECTQSLEATEGAYSLTGWDAPLYAAHLTGNREARTVHFGFRDGLSQPYVEGVPGRSGGSPVHRTGEFLLGYVNDAGFNYWAEAGELGAFFKNGSFAALRKMQQYEGRFRAFVDRAAAQLGVSRELVRAKLCGRWDDGSLIEPGQKQPLSPATPAPGRDQDFDYSKDPRGLGCPFSAHTRRMNPRDDPVVPFRRRPLIRRGMPYGSAYEEAPHDGAERGLLGLFFCASIEDQFEHLLTAWGNRNPMGPNNPSTVKDPLIGNHESSASLYAAMPDGETKTINGFEPFTATRGTLYAFFPSLSALRTVAL